MERADPRIAVLIKTVQHLTKLVNRKMEGVNLMMRESFADGARIACESGANRAESGRQETQNGRGGRWPAANRSTHPCSQAASGQEQRVLALLLPLAAASSCRLVVAARWRAGGVRRARRSWLAAGGGSPRRTPRAAAGSALAGIHGAGGPTIRRRRRLRREKQTLGEVGERRLVARHPLLSLSLVVVHPRGAGAGRQATLRRAHWRNTVFAGD